MLAEEKRKQIFLDDPQLMESYTTQFPLGKMTDLQSLAAKPWHILKNGDGRAVHIPPYREAIPSQVFS